MTLKILVRKLNMSDDKYIASALLKKYCMELGLDYYSSIRYLTSNKYLHRILKGIFYKPSIEERKLKKIGVSNLEAVSYALKIKNIKNWYLGLESALKMNNLTHEFFAIDYIINDTIFRASPFKIFGSKVKFIKLKKPITAFGINRKGRLRYSDPEKTVLDVVYLSKYRGLNETEIKDRIYGILKACSKEKLKKYSARYNKQIARFIGGLI